MHIFSRNVLVTCLLVLLATSIALGGATPSRLNYQGLLTDADGQPLNATGLQMTFRIWAHPYSADPADLKWEETLLVDVIDGLFNVILGDNLPIEDSVFSESERFLGIQIGSEAEGAPRTRLVSVGYSTRVETLDGARGGVISGSISLEPGGSTKEGADEDLKYLITNEINAVTFYANSEEVFTPCVLFADDASRQCTAAINTGVSQSEESETVTTLGETPTLLAQESIDCPAEGFVLVLASCEAALDLVDGAEVSSSPEIIHTYTAEFGVSTSATELPDDQHKRWSVTDVLPYLRTRNVISVHKVFSVEPGTSTFYFLGTHTAGEEDFTAADKTMTLVYIPKAYGAVSASAIGNGSTVQLPSNRIQAASSKVQQNSNSDIAQLKAEVAELKAMLKQVMNGNEQP